MKKFTKSGHLEGNTNVSLHTAPFIHGTVPVDSSGYIATLNALSPSWTVTLHIETEAISSLEVTLKDTTTNDGTLEDIVTLINTAGDPHDVEASILGGSLLLQNRNAGEGKYIRIKASSSPYDSAAPHFGLRIHPHSQATVYSGDIKSSSTDTLDQQNATGTKFIAKGEDRTSESYNRALAGVSANVDSHQTMLARGIGYQVTVKLENNILSPLSPNARFHIDGSKVIAISLSSSVGDSLDSLFESRVLVGTLTRSSTVREVRELFQLVDSKGREILSSEDSLPVYVTTAITGAPTAPPSSGAPLDLNDQPASSYPNSTGIGDSGCVFGVDIPKASSETITGYNDKHTIVCSGASFVTDGVAAGDRVTLSGTITVPYSNDGDYLVENVISETELELKPAEYTDVAYLNTENPQGTLSVSSGGMWLKNITLYLHPPIQLPIDDDLYLKVPLEEITGDLPEDALVTGPIVEVPNWVLQNLYKKNSLDGAFTGTATTRKGAGYYMDADVRSAEIKPSNYASNTAGTGIRTVNSCIVLTSNRIAIDSASTDSFTEADIGRFLRLNGPSNSISAPPADNEILDGDMVVIVELMDSKTVTVRRTSRSTVDLPTAVTLTSVTVVGEDATVLFPGALSIPHTYDSSSPSAGGIVQIIDTPASSASIDYPESNFKYLELERVVKIDNGSTATTSVFQIDTSTNPGYVRCTGVNGTYLNLSFPHPPHTVTSARPANLVLRIFNGINAGFYLVERIYSLATPTDLVVKPLAYTSQNPGATATAQYACFYRIAEGSRVLNVEFQSPSYVSNRIQKFISAAGYSASDDVTGLSVTWKGFGTGISVFSNVHDNSADSVRSGAGSIGDNIVSVAGPGTESAIKADIKGLRGFSAIDMFGYAEVSYSSAQGRGGWGVHSVAQTYHLDPLQIQNTEFFTATFSYKGGAGYFLSNSNDPAVVAASSVSTIKTTQASSSSLVAINEHGSSSSFGLAKSAVSIYGSLMLQGNDSLAEKVPPIVYTEGVASFAAAFSSEPKGIEDINSSTVKSNIAELGSAGVFGRSTSTGAQVLVTAQSSNFNLFNIPHSIVIQVSAPIPSSVGVYGDFLDLDLSLRYQDAVGSFVFFVVNPRSGATTTFNEINQQSSDNTLHSLPFNFDGESDIEGCKRGFKIIAATIDSGNVYFALDMEDENDSPTLTTGRVDCIFYRKRFKGSLDLLSWMRIGYNKSQLEKYGYANTTSSNTAHQYPVLSSVDLNDSISQGTTNTSGGRVKSQGSRNTRSLTRQNYPLSTGQGMPTDSNPSTPLSTKRAFDRAGGFGSTYQSSNYVIKPTDVSYGGFNTEGSVGQLNDSSYFGCDDVIVTSQHSSISVPDNKLHCISGTNGKENDIGGLTSFGGGGRKLVLHTRHWDSTFLSGSVSHEIVVKIGARHLWHSNGFNVDLTFATTRGIGLDGSGRGDLVFQVALLKELSASSSLPEGFTKNITIPTSSSSIYYQEYQTESLFFTKNELDAVKDLLDNTDISLDNEESFFLRIKCTLQCGYISYSSLSSSQRTAVESALGITPGLSAFPDVVYIHSIVVKHDSKQALVSSGLDVGGALRPRNLRLLNAVTGHQVVGPASVDLLQNSEYGNSQGHGSLYTHEPSSDVGSGRESITTPSDIADKGNNIEGRDVGLLPMWFLVFGWDTGSSSNFPNARGWSTAVSIDGLELTSYTSNIVSSSNVTYSNYVDTLDLTALYLEFDSLVFQVYKTASPHTPYLNVSFFKDNQEFDGGSPTGNFRIKYKAPLAFTRFYRPIFDKASFFRKGVHSAAIHAHIPYFDPMFYWEHSAAGVIFGRQLDKVEEALSDISPGWNPASSNYSLDNNVSRWEIGSYRTLTGSNTTPSESDILDHSVSPDSYIPPGKTGFVVPLDPPHGSVMTSIDLNISFRPTFSRKISSADNGPSTDVISDYGVWHTNPASTASTGSTWLSRSYWTAQEGYKVRVWRHSPFAEGVQFGNDPDNSSSSFTNISKELDGNATLIHEQTVYINRTKSTDKDGQLGAASNYIDSLNFEIQEAISRLKIILPSGDPMFLVNRAEFSYFVTIEFYAGVRKTIDRRGTETYTVPGLNAANIDRHNMDHFPYMWTPAFPGYQPNAMSSIYGNDAATRWQGYWEPFPHYAGFDRYHRKTIYRYHPSNIQGDANIVIVTNSDGRETTGESSAISPTISTRDVPNATTGIYGQAAIYHSNSSGTAAALMQGGSTSPLGWWGDTNGSYMPDQTVWYPVVKFRGLRLTYQMDRPGHGGWGG